jgi:hypothetical protein
LGADGTTRLPGGWFGDRDDVDGADMKIYKFEGYIAAPDFISPTAVKAGLEEILGNDESADAFVWGPWNGKVTKVNHVKVDDPVTGIETPEDVGPFGFFPIEGTPITNEQIEQHDAAWEKWFEKAGDKLDQYMGKIHELEIKEVEEKVD